MLKKILFRSVMIMMVISLAGGMGACKSKKKLAKITPLKEIAIKYLGLATGKAQITDTVAEAVAVEKAVEETAEEMLQEASQEA